MDKLFFVGIVPPYSIQQNIPEWGSRVDNASYTFQKAILSGFYENSVEVLVFTSVWIDYFPKSHKILLKKFQYSHLDENNAKGSDVFLGLVNLPGIKRLSQFFRLRKALKRHLVGCENNVVSYALMSQHLLAIVSLRRRIKNACVIIPDLPEYMSDSNNLLYKIGKYFDRRIINFCLKRFDSFSVLSPYMIEKLPIGDKPWNVVEGIYDFGANERVHVKKSDKIIIFYSGLISRRYGVYDLIEAFKGIEGEAYELQLCGVCEDSDSFQLMISEDKRINYLGVIPRESVLILQSQATLLVNPRHSGEIFTKYSFPSKTMEYMASGTPVLMSNLECLPDEYKPFLFFFEDESVEGMKNKIKEVCNLKDCILIQRGKEAANYIKENKNSKKQADKIIDLMNKNC